jgi:hypothetical protein
MSYVEKGSSCTVVKLLPCNHEVMGSSLAEMQGKAVYIRPKVVGPFPGPTQAGATCTGLPFFKHELCR